MFELFDRVVVVNLPRRQDRWQRFLSRLPSDWPFRSPLRFPAVDGKDVEIPKWWTAGAGAWGCYRSHLAVLEDCLHEHIESVLIVEDDAVFLPAFSSNVRRFVSCLPENWRWIYLGGQHIELHAGEPRKINDWVYRPYNVNRTHCYAVRGREAIETLVEHLRAESTFAKDHHIDHHLGELQKQNFEGLYVPRTWLVGQLDGPSDVNNRNLGVRTFRSAESIVNARVDLPMVAVVGNYSGGTSAVAGILHMLGISMGEHFEPADSTNVNGNFEAQGLAELCRRCYAEPWLTERLDATARTRLLRIWASERCDRLRGTGHWCGGKHPLLSFMIPELSSAWNSPSIISVERDREATLNSLLRRNWKWPVESCMLVTDQLRLARAQSLTATELPHLILDYEDVVADVRSAISKICQFLQFYPSPEAISKAIGFVTNHRKH